MKYYMYCLLLAVSFCLTTYGQSSEWNEWKQKYNKQYSTSTEELYRHAVWKKNLQYVEKHNSDLNTEFKLEMNEFADQEASRRPKIDLQSISVGIRPTRHDLVYLPSSFDWRKKGVIEPVRNQGQMGSSLSIVATECMNSYSCIKTGHLVSASEQEVWDCCTKTATLSTLVFDCIHNIGGLCSSADYPNRGSLGSCKNSTCTPIVKNQGSVQVITGREDQLQIAVLVCPVLVAIDASHASFQLYRSGVYDEPACSSTALDHVVQLVGYGSANGMDYWIVKNSWGVAWGMEGYILMSRNKNNQCGIASAAVYPV